jgi:hypothetical protein
MGGSMKIVKFKNGTYGIRKGWLFYRYRDLELNYWWPLSSKYFKDCQASLEIVQNAFDGMQDKGTPL